MGRLPYCDKLGVKKGPWTPEEDIVLVSYIQDHGPNNWRTVPANTGLLRCSKSCRLRWTNYLRPGIKRGNFTDQEEKLIIHLQALLGNRWAAISSYLPNRTDNDIKNHWNTHLIKRINNTEKSNATTHSGTKGKWEKCLQTDIQKAKKALHEALSMDHKTTNLSHQSKNEVKPYACNTENISKLLQNWVKNPSKQSMDINISCGASTCESTSSSSCHEGTTSSNNSNCTMSPNLLSFEEIKSAKAPLALIESWLFDESNNTSVDQVVDLKTCELLYS